MAEFLAIGTCTREALFRAVLTQLSLSCATNKEDDVSQSSVIVSDNINNCEIKSNVVVLKARHRRVVLAHDGF